MSTPLENLPTAESEDAKKKKKQLAAAVVAILVAAGLNVYQAVDQDTVMLGEEEYSVPNEIESVEDAYATLQDVIHALNVQLDNTREMLGAET